MVDWALQRKVLKHQQHYVWNWHPVTCVKTHKWFVRHILKEFSLSIKQSDFSHLQPRTDCNLHSGHLHSTGFPLISSLRICLWLSPSYTWASQWLSWFQTMQTQNEGCEFPDYLFPHYYSYNVPSLIKASLWWRLMACFGTTCFSNTKYTLLTASLFYVSREPHPGGCE